MGSGYARLNQFVRLFGALGFRLLHFGGFGFFGGAFEVQGEQLVAGRKKIVKNFVLTPIWLWVCFSVSFGT
jgi:hypothetical protein